MHPQGVKLQINFGPCKFYHHITVIPSVISDFFSCKLQAAIYVSLHGSILVAWDLEIYGVMDSRGCQEP